MFFSVFTEILERCRSISDQRVDLVLNSCSMTVLLVRLIRIIIINDVKAMHYHIHSQIKNFPITGWSGAFVIHVK